MFRNASSKKIEFIRKIFVWHILSAFLMVTILPLGISYAQVSSQAAIPGLPVPGTMIEITPSYQPPLLTGMSINFQDPLQFNFFVDAGEEDLDQSTLHDLSMQFIKYFMAALTVPEDEMWVNLSPGEANRVIPDSFSKTAMGRDLLIEDYMLKQITSSLMHPDSEEGARFWQEIYKRAEGMDVSVDTFNKVWIVPEKAHVYVTENKVFVVDSRLRVMLEDDYAAEEESFVKGKKVKSEKNISHFTLHDSQKSKKVVREVLLPVIEREVNEGKTFTKLRQVYNALILATWYKKNLKDSILGQHYVDQHKIESVQIDEQNVGQKVYRQYMYALEKGVFNFIREDVDPYTQEIIPRKYFSGGIDYAMLDAVTQEVVSANPSRVYQKFQNMYDVDMRLNILEEQPDRAMLEIERTKARTLRRMAWAAFLAFTPLTQADDKERTTYLNAPLTGHSSLSFFNQFTQTNRALGGVLPEDEEAHQLEFRMIDQVYRDLAASFKNLRPEVQEDGTVRTIADAEWASQMSGVEYQLEYMYRLGLPSPRDWMKMELGARFAVSMLDDEPSWAHRATKSVERAFDKVELGDGTLGERQSGGRLDTEFYIRDDADQTLWEAEAGDFFVDAETFFRASMHTSSRTSFVFSGIFHPAINISKDGFTPKPTFSVGLEVNKRVSDNWFFYGRRGYTLALSPETTGRLEQDRTTGNIQFGVQYTWDDWTLGIDWLSTDSPVEFNRESFSSEPAQGNDYLLAHSFESQLTAPSTLLTFTWTRKIGNVQRSYHFAETGTEELRINEGGETFFADNRQRGHDWSVGAAYHWTRKTRYFEDKDKKEAEPGDQAMTPGGIDMNPSRLDLEVEGEAMKFEIPEKYRDIDFNRINNFVPVINVISPVMNLPLLLGFDEPEPLEGLASSRDYGNIYRERIFGIKSD